MMIFSYLPEFGSRRLRRGCYSRPPAKARDSPPPSLQEDFWQVERPARCEFEPDTSSLLHLSCLEDGLSLSPVQCSTFVTLEVAHNLVTQSHRKLPERVEMMHEARKKDKGPLNNQSCQVAPGLQNQSLSHLSVSQQVYHSSNDKHLEVRYISERDSQSFV